MKESGEPKGEGQGQREALTLSEKAAEALRALLRSYLRERVKDRPCDLGLIKVEDYPVQQKADPSGVSNRDVTVKRQLGAITRNAAEQMQIIVVEAQVKFISSLESGTEHAGAIQAACDCIDKLLSGEHRISYQPADLKAIPMEEATLAELDAGNKMGQGSSGRPVGEAALKSMPAVFRIREAAFARVKKTKPRAFKFLQAMLESNELTRMAQNDRFPSHQTEEVSKDIAAIFALKRKRRGPAAYADPFARAGFTTPRTRSDWKGKLLREVRLRLKEEFAAASPRLSAEIEERATKEILDWLDNIHYRKTNYTRKVRRV